MAPAPGDVVVRTEFTAISRGTESLVFLGRIPAGERERMRAPFQAGEFPGPVKYGYANVGVVEQGPPALCGKRVFALYPHQTAYAAPADAVYVLPDAVPSARAVLAANLETAVNGLWDAQLQVGDRAVVVGAGAVGCLVARLASRVTGTDVELVDVNPSRAAIATALGVRFSDPSFASRDADVVFHTSGTAAGLATALELAAFEATVVEMSWYGDEPVAAPLGHAFHSQRLTLKASQVGSVPPARRARWTNRRRLELAIQLLDDAALDVVVTGESPFDELPAVMARLAEGPREVVCHRIAYR